MTVYSFVQQNRVEVVFNRSGKYDCYINFKEGDKPWASASNALDAIDAAVTNYIQSSRGPKNIDKEENDKLRLFLSRDALFIWYFYARKYDKKKIVSFYENLASVTHGSYLHILRLIFDKVNEAVDNPGLKLDDNYPALNNIFIQALVYHESLAKEKYETNKIIFDMHDKLKQEDKEAFDKIQDTIKKIETEIQNIIEE